MYYLDETQRVISDYLDITENMLNELLINKKFCGHAKIQSTLDLGFPHDVIRLGGGFATGIYLEWDTQIPFIPVDICMNACTVSIYELAEEIAQLFCDDNIQLLLKRLEMSSYKANFHRGNHFISYLESVKTHIKYVMIHSSAAEFETNYNGLYPVEGNFVYSNTKKFFSKTGRYLRYLEGAEAELFARMASNLYKFNENRHDFIISSFLGCCSPIKSSSHFHHYGMPSENEAIIGCHKIKKNDIVPLLSRPGENVFLIKYANALDKGVIARQGFITPHGLGKMHCAVPKIRVNVNKEILYLDEIAYELKYGVSLRDHPGLKLRDIQMNSFFKVMEKTYNFEIIDEFKQICSLNKNGLIFWEE